MRGPGAGAGAGAGRARVGREPASQRRGTWGAEPPLTPSGAERHGPGSGFFFFPFYIFGGGGSRRPAAEGKSELHPPAFPRARCAPGGTPQPRRHPGSSAPTSVGLELPLVKQNPFWAFTSTSRARLRASVCPGGQVDRT